MFKRPDSAAGGMEKLDSRVFKKVFAVMNAGLYFCTLAGRRLVSAEETT